MLGLSGSRFCARLRDFSFEDAVVGCVSCSVAKPVGMIFPFLLPRGGCRESTSFKIRHLIVFFLNLIVVFHVVVFCGMVCCIFSEDGVLDVFAVPGIPGSVHCDIDVESCSPVRGGICVRGARSKFSGIVGRALIHEAFLSIRSSSSSLEVFPMLPDWKIHGPTRLWLPG